MCSSRTPGLIRAAVTRSGWSSAARAAWPRPIVRQQHTKERQAFIALKQCLSSMRQQHIKEMQAFLLF